MNILVACEWSGTVRDAFIRKGHDVLSCDLDPGEGEFPQRHFRGKVEEILWANPWDMIIAFPPCTYLTVAGNRWYSKKPDLIQKGRDFFMMFANRDVPRIAIENPVGRMSTLYRKPDQYIQPWQFGHGETKKTGLWLKGLPLLTPANVVEGREQRVWKMGPSPERSKLRGKTYQGIADAMAEQWGTQGADNGRS